MVKVRKLQCSFCGRKDSEVEKLVAGPRVFICDRCVEIANQLMKGEPGESKPSEPQSSFLQRITTSIGRWLGRHHDIALRWVTFDN
jgi:ATP-dependent protease Clp ATPase subunit